MSAAGEPIHVLHVDDDAEFVETAAALVEREGEGLTVETATSAREGLNRIAEGAVDCVVSDYEMPGLDGIEFLESVRDEHPHLPFLLYTGKGSESVAGDAISAGATDYLQKESGTDQYALLATKIRNAVERTRAERARERNFAAIETAREGISILDDDGTFVYVNEAYADLYGYDPAEMVGEHWTLIYPEREADFARDEILPTVVEKGYWHGETTGLRADGTTFPEDHVVSRTADDYLVCTVRDLSDRRERETELHWRTRAIDEAPVGITISDPERADNPLVYANERFEELTGYSAADVHGHNCRFLQGPGTDPERVEEMRAAIDAGESVTVTLRNYRTDGTEFWNHVTIAPVEDETGDVVRFIGFQEDVTERRERRRELRRYEQMVDTMQEAACIYDEEGRFEVVNEYLADFYGTTPAELEGEPSNLIPRIRENGEGDPYGELLAGERDEISGEISGEFPGHGYEVLEYRLAPLVADGTVEGVVGVAHEVTDHRQRQRELERQNERLDEFASIVSHDLRNPLQIAQGRLELAMDECDSDHLQDVADAHGRMNDLIDDLLTLAREGDEVEGTETVDLAALVERCWRNVSTADATVVAETERTVAADSDRLRQLFENLLHNAVEHGGDDVTVTVGDTEDGFYVADDGPGIPEDKYDEVFGAGYSTSESGTGFGLRIVRQMAEAHGWSVRATESDAGGARFEVTGVDGGA